MTGSRRRIAVGLLVAAAIPTVIAAYVGKAPPTDAVGFAASDPGDSPEKAVRQLMQAAQLRDLRLYLDRLDTPTVALLSSSLIPPMDAFGEVLSATRTGDRAMVQYKSTFGRSIETIPCVLENGRWRVSLPR